MTREFVTTDEAARRLAVNRRTITRWCRGGQVPGAVRTPGGHWRVPADWAGLEDDDDLLFADEAPLPKDETDEREKP